MRATAAEARADELAAALRESRIMQKEMSLARRKEGLITSNLQASSPSPSDCPHTSPRGVTCIAGAAAREVREWEGVAAAALARGRAARAGRQRRARVDSHGQGDLNDLYSDLRITYCTYDPTDADTVNYYEHLIRMPMYTCIHL